MFAKSVTKEILFRYPIAIFVQIKQFEPYLVSCPTNLNLESDFIQTQKQEKKEKKNGNNQ